MSCYSVELALATYITEHRPLKAVPQHGKGFVMICLWSRHMVLPLLIHSQTTSSTQMTPVKSSLLCRLLKKKNLSLQILKSKLLRGKQILMCIRNHLTVLRTHFCQHTTYTKTSIIFQKLLLLDYDVFAIKMKGIIRVLVNIRII